MDKREQEVAERRQNEVERPDERIDDLAPDKDASAEVKGGRLPGAQQNGTSPET